MLKHFEEFGAYVEITGFSNVQIEDTKGFLKSTRMENQDVAVQLFNAELVATWQHLYFAVLNALTAFSNQTNVSKSLAVETMLYASAQRQIKKAIAFLGVKRDSMHVVVVLIGENSGSVEAALSSISKTLGSEPDDSVLALSASKVQSIREAFSVSDEELATVTAEGAVETALVDLVIEHVALLSTQL